MTNTWLVRFGLWLAKLGGWEEPVPPPPEIHEVEVEVIREVVQEVEVVREVEVIKPRYEMPDDIVREARFRVVEQNERWPEREGESKRAAVYRVLTNIFPEASKRDISRAIEEAVCLDC